MERKIEKLLRAYAKKRRGQAGESFKLDPETRRILQNEISGSAPSSEDDDETMSLWEVFRRYWAFFLGFAVCIFIVASFFLHPLPNAKKKEMLSMSSQTLGGQNMRQIHGRMQSAPLAKSDSTVTNTVVFSEKIQSQQLAFGSAGSGPITNQKSTPIAMSNRRPSADRSEAGAESSLAGSLNNASAPATPALESQSATLVTREATPPPATMPPGPTGGEYAMAPMPAASAELSGNLNTVRQFQSVQNVQNAFMNTVAPASQSGTVLSSFRVEQSGNVIRVVDQDGSVYKGMLNTGESEPNTVTASGRLVAGNAMTLSDTAAQNAPKAESPRRAESDKLSPSSPVYYSFRVGGMNQTLKQPVVFTATLIENLEVMKNTQVTFGMSANVAYGAALAQQMMRSGQTNQTMQLPWSSLRIAGTAVVNRTNHIEINAAPVQASSNGGLPK
jgi:hypothetical protein